MKTYHFVMSSITLIILGFATITANGPFGKYTLPSIDVNQLLSAKQSQTTPKE